jgi:hypothetical protein
MWLGSTPLTNQEPAAGKQAKKKQIPRFARNDNCFRAVSVWGNLGTDRTFPDTRLRRIRMRASQDPPRRAHVSVGRQSSRRLGCGPPSLPKLAARLGGRVQIRTKVWRLRRLPVSARLKLSVEVFVSGLRRRLACSLLENRFDGLWWMVCAAFALKFAAIC